MNFLSILWSYVKTLSLVAALIVAILAGGWAAYAYDSSKKPPIVAKQLIVEGDNALNIGRYADAKRIFEDEFKTNPQNKQAAWSLKIAEIPLALSEREYKEATDELYQQDPKDSHVNLFLGEFYAATNQPDKAIQHFEQAITQNPKLAEAHYNLAILYDQQGNYEAAKVESLKAIDSSPIPKYKNNLGNIYFKQLRYEEAINEYGKNKEYPLSALESAKIYWHLEYLSQAMSYQKQALYWLEDKQIMGTPENKDAWYFEIPPGKRVKLVTLEEKKSYALYCLSVSLYLQGDTKGAEEELKKIRDLNLGRQTTIDALLTADLEALVQANTSLAERVAAYKTLHQKIL